MAIIVVDAYSTGRPMAEHLRALRPNERIWHLRSSNGLPDALTRSFSAGPFNHDFDVGKLDSLITSLTREPDPIEHVIPGADPGVELAERLAADLGCATGNVLALSRARFDKQAMHSLGKAWCVRTDAVRSGQHARTVLRDYPETTHFVVKPPRSSATDGVRRCESKTEAIKYAEELLGRRHDLFGHAFDHVLVQEFIEGPEFCVDAISVGGRHFFTDVWRYHKVFTAAQQQDRKVHDRTPIYGYDDLVDPQSIVSLLECAADVLTSVGIRYGASHTEIILKDERTPLLVETTPRLTGCINRPAFLNAAGVDPTLMAAQAYVAPDAVSGHPWVRVGAFGATARRSRLRRVHLIAPHDGGFDQTGLKTFLEDLPTYWKESLVCRVAHGDQVKRTHDLMSSPGFFFLSGEDDGAIQGDFTRFLEAQGQFFR